MRATALVLLPLLLWAQPEFFGYYESELDAIGFGNKSYVYNYNKLRLDVEARPSDRVQIGANFNVQHYLGKTTWDLFDFLPDHTYESLDMLGVAEFPFPIPDTSYVDNFYIRLQLDRADLTLGKQQLSYGTGYAWNPTDIFNYKQLLDPSYEQTGVSAVRLELPLAYRLNLDIVYRPEKDWESSAKQLQLKVGLGRFDIAGNLAEYEWSRTQFNDPLAAAGTVIPPPLFTTATTKRSMLGGSIVGELLGFGLWAEGAQNQLEGDDDFLELVVGLDYTFENSSYFLVEYLYNENGLADKAALTLTEFLRSLNGETHSLMQNYGFLYFMDPVGDFGTLTFLGFANFDDQSFAINPGFEWAGFENMNFSFISSIMAGEDDTEFGLQDWGLRIRIRGYF